MTDPDEVEFQPPRPLVRPGPGLPESLVWVFITIMLQVVAAVVVMIAMLITSDKEGLKNLQAVDAWIENLPPTRLLVMIGLPGLLAYILLIPAGLLRLGRGATRKLNFESPSLTQLSIVVSTVLPLSIIADALFGLGNDLWHSALARWPALEPLEGTNVMAMLQQVEHANLGLLLLFIAAVPAIGEEFVFRGLIGRGLTARWGIAVGVVLTTILFAVVHMYPPHVLAVLPVGLVMHIVYLSTRSFWAPMLFHFTNNALAVIALSAGFVEKTQEFRPALFVMAMLHVALSLFLLWRHRTRYVMPDGRSCSPGYFTVQVPPPRISPTRMTASSPVAIGASLLLLGGWIAVFLLLE